MILFTPPEPVPRDIHKKPSFFLSGSVKTKEDIPWRQEVLKTLADYDCYVLDPTRNDWDSSWICRIGNPKFRQQIEWELTGLERVSHILTYFEPGTEAPTTLLEMGLFSMGPGGELIVCCPEGFWRKGNVDIVCDRYEIDTEPNLGRLIQRAIEEIKRWERTRGGTAEWRLNR